jgi:hypothetical protein
MAYCKHCEKEVDPAIELIPDTTEFQGREVQTGFFDMVEVCPDCGVRVQSTADNVSILVEEFEEIPF